MMIPNTYPASSRKRWTVTIIRCNGVSDSFRVYALSMYEAEARAVERCFGTGSFFSFKAGNSKAGHILGPKRDGVSTVYACGVTIKTAPGW